MKQVDANENNSELDSSQIESKYNHQQQPQSRPPATKMSTYHRLIEACKLKELATIGSILSERPQLVNQKDKHNRTLLHYAAILLIDDDRHPQQRRQSQQAAAAEAQKDNCIKCFNYLTDRCDVKLWWQQDLDGLSVLHLAVISSNVPLVKHIIYEHPYSIKYPLVCTLDNELHSPLHWAVITNNLECVRLLIGYAGAKLAHESDLNGATPLHYATQTSDYPKYRRQLRLMLKSVGQQESKRQQQQAVATCKEGTDSHQTSIVDHTQQRKQAETASIPSTSADVLNQRSLEILEFLVRLPQINLECMDKDRRTPLLWAASSGNRGALVLLLSNGANVSSCDMNKLGALHCAASHGFTDCLECLLGLSLAGAQLVNQPDNLNCTPLFYGVLSGNIDCVETLLERGAKQDWQDTKGRTAAHFAALKGQLNSLKLLHERGANLWLPNKQGDLPLHYAIKSSRQQVVRWLLEHSPYERAVNAINNHGRAPIHLAIQKDNLAMVDYLIRCGANLNQLVKIRDNNRANKQRDQKEFAPVDGSDVDQTKSGQYNYETALDMARNLNRKDCFRLLVDKKALSAAQVIRNRSGTGSTISATRSFPSGSTAAASGNVRSLFDLQSVNGPSPIGFETSCSSVSPNTLSNTDALEPRRFGRGSSVSQVPKLARPQPDSLPQTDSTGSSALSQNSLTSVRSPQQQTQTQKRQQQQQPQQYQQHQQAASGSNQQETINIAQAALHDSGIDHNEKPYRGGISYNNELINASIKCKLYGDTCSYQQASRHRTHANHRSFPQQGSGAHGRQSRSLAGRASQSAPVDGGAAAHRTTVNGGQEIITNVNVYTSPCPHCAHHKLDQCIQCTLDSHQKHQLQSYKDTAEAAATGRQQQVGPGEFFSDETSDATTESEDIERSFIDHLPSLAQQHHLQQQLVQSAGVTSFARTQLRHLPSQQRPLEQHLPVILSERESPSATSGERSQRSPEELASGDFKKIAGDTSLPSTQQQQQQQPQASGQYSKGAPTISSAGEEPRFDRSERSRAAHRVDRYRDHVRSPVADYIHGGSSPMSPMTSGGQYEQTRPVSLGRGLDDARATSRQQAYHRSDYSQVKAKVDSHREADDEHLRAKSMSALSSTQAHQLHTHHPHHHRHNQQQQHFSQHHHQRSPLHGEQAAGTSPRSCSRQTIIKTRRLSVDSVELASSVEKSIRKYKQETKLFEELQNLKRSQIRSGRANEALLVKRLIEHFRQDTLDLIGLEVYHGPYTYKSYERYLYDQLRKLSHSNCAKLGSHFKHLADQQHGSYPLDDDLRADLELRRVIHGDGVDGAGNESDQESYILEPSGALEEIRVKSSRHHDDSAELEDYDEAGDAYDRRRQRAKKHSEESLQREWIHKRSDDGDGIEDEARRPTVDELRQQRSATAAVGSSLSSSRRSSVEVEREKLLGLPLKVVDKASEEAAKTAEDAGEEQIGAEASNSVEEQAESLSSSILVDALGNVSRSGSPVLKLLESLDTDKQQQKQASELARRSSVGSSDGDAGDEEESEGEPAPPPTGTNRKRSVVNIGNKMEVIYHDVGIEINPAADSDHDSVDRQQLQQQQQEGLEKQLEDVEELEEERGSMIARNDDYEGANADSGSDEGMAVSSERRRDSAVQLAEESAVREEPCLSSVEPSDEVGGGRIETENLARFARMSESSGVGSTDSLAQVRSEASRRASSPHVHRLGTDQPTVGQPTSLVPTARSTAGRPEMVDTQPKRVFTGYDLDEMHRGRLRRAPTPLVELSVEGDNKEQAASQEQDMFVGKRKAAAGENGEREEIETETVGSWAEAETRRKPEEKLLAAGDEQEEEVATTQGRTLVAPMKRRLKPSQPPPKGAYKLRVPIGEVKKRWSRVKAEQKKRRRIRTRGDQVDHSMDAGRQRSAAAAIPTDKSLTKSQPSLRGEAASELDASAVKTQADYSNYTLIYEINKSSRSPSAKLVSTKSTQAPTRSDWCQRRAVKIVDVRTLKRTLSLPESLIYSNDLLKRFNILKL